MSDDMSNLEIPRQEIKVDGPDLDYIVDVLRSFDNGKAVTHHPDCWKSHPVCAGHLAALEIERLRAEVNLWMGAAERFAESDPKFEAFRLFFRARAKAVRGE